MSDVNDPQPESEEEPSADELKEPSTEKDPGEEPKAVSADDAEPDHEAVGIGIIDGPAPDGQS